MNIAMFPAEQPEKSKKFRYFSHIYVFGAAKKSSIKVYRQ
jgi:hypothetical protein